jgi:hypothetical protein
MARRPAFEDLPVGACFAFDAGAKRATRRKVDAHHTILIPGGKRPMPLHDVETPVTPTACPTSFGRRKRRRNSTKKRNR